MTKDTSDEQTAKSIAMVDDAFAPPSTDSVRQEHVGEFCDAVRELDLESQLTELIGNSWSEPADVTDAHIAKLFEHRSKLPDIEKEIGILFGDYSRRLKDLTAIGKHLETFGFDVERFSSEEELFAAGQFHVVFLDLYLQGDDEAKSEQIAKRIYAEFKSFIFLMSDREFASTREEEFRRRSRLLRGFFHFCSKKSLCDQIQMELHLGRLPSDSKICHAIHEFVDSVEHALGGQIEEPNEEMLQSGKGLAISQFMKTLRTLGLQDYAMLCELTLRDEGHPLGDYLMRLLCDYLNEPPLPQPRLKECVRNLDRMRFTEFLPFHSDTSDSLKELYAASLCETVASPWASHPWDSTLPEGQTKDERDNHEQDK